MFGPLPAVESFSNGGFGLGAFFGGSGGHGDALLLEEFGEDAAEECSGSFKRLCAFLDSLACCLKGVDPALVAAGLVGDVVELPISGVAVLVAGELYEFIKGFFFVF